ncbi:MAG: hypothetical protein ABIR36_12575 [Nitrospiraceae bacterium]
MIESIPCEKTALGFQGQHSVDLFLLICTHLFYDNSTKRMRALSDTTIVIRIGSDCTSHKDGVIRFFFHPAEVIRGKEGSEVPMAALPIEAAILQQYLEKYSKFATAVLSPSAPALGSYIVISKTTMKSNMFGSVSCGFGAATLLYCLAMTLVPVLLFDTISSSTIS